MSVRAEIKQIMFDLLLAQPQGRDEIAHFCTHSGIRIRFTRARTTWLALVPSGIKPWCLLLEPIRENRNVKHENVYNNNETEVIKNA